MRPEKAGRMFSTKRWSMDATGDLPATIFTRSRAVSADSDEEEDVHEEVGGAEESDDVPLAEEDEDLSPPLPLLSPQE